MKKLKKVIRLMAVVLLMLLASIGVAFGAVLPAYRGKYQDKEVTIELVEAREEDREHESEAEKS